MKKLLAITCLLTISSLQAVEFEVKESKEIKPDKISIPVELVDTDDNITVYSKGTELNSVRGVVLLDKNLNTSKIIELPTKLTDRVNYIIWTGEQVIVLWEKKVKFDMELSYQTFDKTGKMTTPRTTLESFKNKFTPAAVNFNVEVIQSPDKEFSGYAINYSFVKSMKDSKGYNDEVLIVFNKKGKKLYSKKRETGYNSDTEGYYFLNNNGEIIKLISQSKQNAIKVITINIENGQLSDEKIPVNFPESSYPLNYKICYHKADNTYNYIATTSNGKKGFNGELTIKLDINRKSQISSSHVLYTDDFLQEFSNSTTYRSDKVLLNDNSLNRYFKLRKPIYKKDGGYYFIKEYYQKTITQFHHKRENAFNSNNIVMTDSPLDFSTQTKETSNILDFIVTNVDKDGKILWIKRIPKSQMTLRMEYGFFDAFVHNDDLYLAYNEGEKNIDKPFKENFGKVNLVMGIVRPIVRKIDNNGNITTFDLSEQLGKKNVFAPFFSLNYVYDADYFITYVKNKANSATSPGKFIRLSVK